MLNDGVVVDSSPIIVLSKAKLIHILAKLWKPIIVPDAVWREVACGSRRDNAARFLTNASSIERATASSIHPLVVAWDLGPGESEVISLAQEMNIPAMVDDRQARKCATSLGVQTLGTGAALVLAKKRGIISSVTEALDAILAAEFWLSEDVVAILKRQAGE